jgi:hypothetical protein
MKAMSPPAGLRPWQRVWFAGQAADFYLLSGARYWTPEELDLMLKSAREDFAIRLRSGDKLMAADRVVLYKVLAQSREAPLVDVSERSFEVKEGEE